MVLPRSGWAVRAIVTACIFTAVALLVWTSAQTVTIAPIQRLIVAIQPLGEVDGAAISAVREAMAESFGAETQVLETKPLPQAAFSARRSRWRAERILESGPGLLAATSEVSRVIFITAADIAVRRFPFSDWGVFGFADPARASCVVSSHRLKFDRPGPELLYARLRKVAIHELGHTLGLAHCPTESCVMHPAEGTIRVVDSVAPRFCGVCKQSMKVVLPQRLLREDNQVR